MSTLNKGIKTLKNLKSETIDIHKIHVICKDIRYIDLT